MEADIVAAVTSAFESAGDLVKDCVVAKISKSSAYDIESDTYTRATTEHACKAILVRFKESEVDGSLVKSTDLKALIPATSVSPAYVPKTSDTFKDHRTPANEYSIESVGIPPSDSLLILRLRKL